MTGAFLRSTVVKAKFFHQQLFWNFVLRHKLFSSGLNNELSWMKWVPCRAAISSEILLRWAPFRAIWATGYGLTPSNKSVKISPWTEREDSCENQIILTGWCIANWFFGVLGVLCLIPCSIKQLKFHLSLTCGRSELDVRGQDGSFWKGWKLVLCFCHKHICSVHRHMSPCPARGVLFGSLRCFSCRERTGPWVRAVGEGQHTLCAPCTGVPGLCWAGAGPGQQAGAAGGPVTAGLISHRVTWLAAQLPPQPSAPSTAWICHLPWERDNNSPCEWHWEKEGAIQHKSWQNLIAKHQPVH